MTLYAVCFYLIAAIILAATALAVTRSNPVQAVVYLVLSFLGTAMLFYLFGAPFPAALEVIIYAGAVMVLFLFVLMMLDPRGTAEAGFVFRQWIPAALLGLVYLLTAVLLVFSDPQARAPLKAAVAAPKELGRFIFEKYWFAVELISLLLLVALLAVIHLARDRGRIGEGEGA
jgi:NADH-quinone oxidoreductase subunit J